MKLYHAFHHEDNPPNGEALLTPMLHDSIPNSDHAYLFFTSFLDGLHFVRRSDHGNGGILAVIVRAKMEVEGRNCAEEQASGMTSGAGGSDWRCGTKKEQVMLG